MSTTIASQSRPDPKVDPAATAFSLTVKPCPASGDGVHSWLFHAACCAVEAGMTNEQAVEAIEPMMTRNPNPSSEIEDALNAARGERSGPSVLWPQINDEQIEAIAQDGCESWTFGKRRHFRCARVKAVRRTQSTFSFPVIRGSVLGRVRAYFARRGVKSGAGDWVNIH